MPVIIVSSRRSGTPTPSTTIFSDSFIEASDTALTAHIPEVGASWSQVTRQAYSGTLNVIASGAHVSASANAADESVAGIASLSGNYPSADYSVEINAVGPNDTTDDTMCLIARYIDTDNYYLAAMVRSAANPDVVLIKIVGGVITTLNSTDAGTVLTSTHNYRFEVQGTDIRFYIDDSLVISTTDSALTAAGRGGFGLGRMSGSAIQDVDTRWQIADFVVTRLI